MAREALPDLSIVLTFLRSAQGRAQPALAEAAGISPNLVNDYERGRKALRRNRLEHLIAFMGYPPDAVDAVLSCLEEIRTAASGVPADPSDRFALSRRRIETVATQVGRMAATFTRSLLTLLTVEGAGLHDRQHAELLWARLKRRSGPERRLLVEEAKEFRSWALCERVAAESAERAPSQPREALELAELALRMAELAPGGEAWRARLQGYALVQVSNSHRTCNDLPEADKVLTRARQLWEAGAAADPGLLNPAWLPWVEAVLRKDQGRFHEASKRIEEALSTDPGELRGKILLSKSSILQILGDPEGSTAALREAAPLLDAGREPRLAFGLRFNLVANLCQLSRAKDAAPRLAELRELAERLGEELDLLRVTWLSGKISAGLGRAAEAQAAFEQVRGAFTRRKLSYECALVSLDLALVLL